MQAPAHSLCVNVHARQCDHQWLLCSTAIMGPCRKPTVPPFAEGISIREMARWRMKILGHFMWNMFKSGYFCDFKHKSWYICSFYLWTLSCNRVIPLALANVLELPLCRVSWESLSVCNNRIRHRWSLTSVSYEMEVNEQETFSASFMLYLSEALDDDDTIKMFHLINSPLMKHVLYSLKRANATIVSLNKRMDEDNTVTTLEHQVWDLEIRVNDLKQEGCCGSMCVWGILEDTPGSVNGKVISPCKN